MPVVQELFTAKLAFDLLFLRVDNPYVLQQVAFFRFEQQPADGAHPFHDLLRATAALGGGSSFSWRFFFILLHREQLGLASKHFNFIHGS